MKKEKKTVSQKIIDVLKTLVDVAQDTINNVR